MNGFLKVEAVTDELVGLFGAECGRRKVIGETVRWTEGVLRVVRRGGAKEGGPGTVMSRVGVLGTTSADFFEISSGVWKTWIQGLEIE